MKVFVLWPNFFGIYGKNVSRIFQNRTPGIRMMNCRKSIYNFIKIVFLKVTGNLRSSFLFNWQNHFSRFLAIVSFVSGGTVWDYNFFIGSITVAGILLDVELQLFWTWADSCRQVFQECIHRVQTNPSMEKISYRKKNRIFHHLQKLSGNVFLKFGRSISRMLSLFGSTCPDETFVDFFWTKNIDTLWPLSKFSRIFGIFLSQPFSEKNSTGRAKELEESFFVSFKVLFLWFPGNWAKVSRLLGDIFSEFFSKVHLTFPEQLFEVKRSFPKS